MNILKEFFHQPSKSHPKNMVYSSEPNPGSPNVQTLTSNDFKANNLGQNIFSPFDSDSQRVGGTTGQFAIAKSSFGPNSSQQGTLFGPLSLGSESH